MLLLCRHLAISDIVVLFNGELETMPYLLQNEIPLLRLGCISFGILWTRKRLTIAKHFWVGLEMGRLILFLEQTSCGGKSSNVSHCVLVVL